MSIGERRSSYNLKVAGDGNRSSKRQQAGEQCRQPAEKDEGKNQAGCQPLSSEAYGVPVMVSIIAQKFSIGVSSWT